MTLFPAEFQFAHPWRPYQQRVLAEFDRHLDDRHFHIVAAPGAGKTVLGLEALRRLQVPSLVLLPTVAIREQWLQRLSTCFLASSELPDWVSCDLLAPGRITLATYQGLHAACRRVGRDRVGKALNDAGVQSLVLDEAHHLRRQWWHCLVKLKSALGAPWLIALTGTPPFDVSQQEWNRYIGLCGSIDAEISTPELVQAGNLCPHQDYIHFSRPSASEQSALDRFDREVRQFLHDLRLDPALLDLLRAHPLVSDPERHLDALNEHSDYLFALLLYLNEAAHEHCRPLLRVLDLSEVGLPGFDIDWAEVLLNGLLFERDPWLPATSPVLHRLSYQLRQFGALELQRVQLRAPPRLERALERGQNKLDSISEIIELESRARPYTLRAVVLCDQLRAADFPQPAAPERSLQQLGVVPVFDRLRRLRLPEVRLALLSGRLVVLPTALAARLQSLLLAAGVTIKRGSEQPLWHDNGFHRFEVGDGQSGAFVAAMTRLFEAGDLNLLVGTAALLGEGWDAPALDTLVLASVVRSAMLSNQMRGRALRSHAQRADKVANIWHLACLRPVPPAQQATPASADYLALQQRFGSFVGIGEQAARIESGLDRLGLDPAQLLAADCAALNARMCRLACDRDRLRAAWARADHSDSGLPRRLLLELRVPRRRLLFTTRLRHATRWNQVWGLRWLYDWLLRRQLTHIAETLLEALRARALIDSPRARIEVALGIDEVRVRLSDATLHDEAPFAEALRELFDLPQNPRYLLCHQGDYFAVPSRLGDSRESAAAFRARFAQRFAPTELIYTRSDSGRRALLKAKEHWLARRFELPCETRMLWG